MPSLDPGVHICDLTPPGAMTDPPADDWRPVVLRTLAAGEPLVRVVLAQVHGSAPRAAGAWLVVTRAAFAGSIGGGRLEWDALARARALLASAATQRRLDRRLLGADCGQCCGGAVDLVFDPLRPDALPWLAALPAAGWIATALDAPLRRVVGRDADAPVPAAAAGTARIVEHAGQRWLLERLPLPPPALWLYGAGHVGRALATVLGVLPYAVRWFDARPGVFPAGLAANLEAVAAAGPLASVAPAPPGTRFVVLTHDHALDFELVAALLARGDAAWIGLIGSAPKAARFRHRLRARGIDPSALVCPIGLPGLAGKRPGEIAVAIAAQLLRDAPP